METRWLYTTSEDFTALREASKDTCIIPMGCVEKHGLHLPLGTDTLQASQIAWMASQLETVCVFPDFTFGDIGENSPNTPAGCISLPLETEILLLEQLCEQIARNGFKKIIIFNGHGGNNPWLSAFLRKIEYKPHDYVVVKVCIKCNIIGRIAKELLKKGPGAFPELNSDDEKLILERHKEKLQDGHGGYSEAAYIMGIDPKYAKLDRLGIVSGKSRNLTQKYKDAGIQIRDLGWEVNFPDWLDSDDPVGCNERIGKVALQIEAERVAQAIKVVKEDEDLLRWHKEMWNSQ